jgi:hypothetical protein
MQWEAKCFAWVALGVALGLIAGCAKSSGSDCGNGRIDGVEQCDGAALTAPDCSAIGLGIGPLKCSFDCTFDVSACSNASVCGNGTVEGTEYCDGFDLGGQTCDTLNLGTGVLGCLPDCSYDTSGCTNSSVCGNGVVEGPEQCDGFNLNGQTCATLGQGYNGGVLACDTASCLYDTSACTQGAVCGNGIREGTELCDGADLAGVTCVTLNFAGGSLSCATDCTHNTSGCTQTAEICNNGVDDDGDGAIDCNDIDCAADPACGGSPEICNNGIDDDQDGLIDCDDQVDCSNDPSCQTTGAEICDNGIDDDGLWGCDCKDVLSCMFTIMCILTPAEETNCSDGQDNDLDCDVDCADADCASDVACGGLVEICDNGTDDDADGDIDCDDSDCAGHASCPLCSPATTIQCGDNLSGNNSGGTNTLSDWGSYCSGVSNTGPESYYVFSHSTGGTVTAELSISGSDDLELFVVGAAGGDCDPSGDCLDYSQSTTTTETVSFTATAGDTYYLIVDGYNGASGAFSLSVTCN